MMMNLFSDRIIRGRLFNPVRKDSRFHPRAGRFLSRAAGWASLVLAGLLLTGNVVGQSLESLADAHRTKPTARTASALHRFAVAHQGAAEGGLALLVLGAEAAKGEPADETAEWLIGARARLPQLADFASYYLALAYSKNEKHANAVSALERVLNHRPPSPLRVQAVLLAARVYLASDDPSPAIDLLREHMTVLPQPQGFSLLARCQEATGDRGAAADSWQQVYFRYPVTAESRDALVALKRLHRRMGRSYPPVPSQLMFERVDRLIKKGQHITARSELQTMTITLGGRDRDRARVWLGKARYIRNHNDVAYKWLKPLKVSDPEVDAERLYYLLESARRINRRTEAVSIAAEMGEKYADSDWRLQGLVSVGNMYLLTNSQEQYVPLYRTCAEAFPAHKRAPYCDWKVVWASYLNRRSEARELLRTHVRDFPSSDKAAAALYYLGRLAEVDDRAAAATWYREIEHEYPNWYYAYRARERLDVIGNGHAESAEVRQFLDTIEFPRRRHNKNFEPTELTSQRLSRAQLLLSAGLYDWGEMELRYGARTGAQGPILAVVLSEATAKEGDYGKSIRYIKGLAPGYLSMPLESAPESFWKLCFPMAYSDTLTKYASKRELDVNFMAALIRQESEFDTRAVSRAKAYGLTQVLPSTGRSLARTLGISGFRTSSLYKPDINVNMGTYYLRKMIDDLEGSSVAALAAYNAGRSRAKRWLTWGEFHEPSEFA
jgi:peptidoglycan lytic transglycosylase